MSLREEIALTDFGVAELEQLEVLDHAACDAMTAWLYDPTNSAKIEANMKALDARARGLADHGTALLKFARDALTPHPQPSPKG